MWEGVSEKKKGEYNWKPCQNHIGNLRSFLKRKRLRCWHLEGLSMMPSTLKKGPDLPNVGTPVERAGKVPQENTRRG